MTKMSLLKDVKFSGQEEMENGNYKLSMYMQSTCQVWKKKCFVIIDLDSCQQLDFDMGNKCSWWIQE